MTPVGITRLAMAMAGSMLAHQVASKAVREAAFLSGPGVARLPLMVFVTAIAVVAAVPGYARLLTRYGPRLVVPAGFLASAALHVIEWQLPSDAHWVAVLIYLHVAGFGSLLLSGFWSMLSEMFDPQSAKSSFGLITAAGTGGGLLGGAAVLAVPIQESLLILAVAHGICAVGLWWLGRRAPVSSLADAEGPPIGLFDRDAVRKAPYLGTVALIVVLGTAAAGIVDFLFKKGVSDWSSERAALQTFFAWFCMAVNLATFAAQAGAGAIVRTLGLGRTIATLPTGVGAASLLALVVPSFPAVTAARGIESVLRGSWFRSGYELLFVPMAPNDKRRTKTFLDVTCDRAGDAVGAVTVQALLFAAAVAPVFAALQYSLLLAIVVAMTAVSLWIGRRIDRLYHGVVANRLADQAEPDTVAVQSETGWTLLEIPIELRQARQETPRAPLAPLPVREVDPKTRMMLELRSGDRGRVEAALRSLHRPDPTEVAQLVQLLAWDDLVPLVRLTLERAAGAHTGLLEDALLDRETDFAIRRRLPRILGSLTSPRALAALVAGLDDGRFEVRYQCARAISRFCARVPDSTVDRDRIMFVIERELSVPLQVWQGHRLLDTGDPAEETDWHDPQHGTTARNLEHVFTLLALVLPREPLQAAYRGLQSGDAELRALTLEYFEGVLPAPLLVRLWALPYFSGVTPSSGDVP